jgi:putative cell wall-binding protein
MKARRRVANIAALVSIVSSSALLSIGADAWSETLSSATASPPLVDVAGQDRYETAALVAEDKYPNGASRVYLATGQNFPDALAASSLSDGPILLVPSTGPVPSTVLAAVSALNPNDVVALGGPASVSDAVLAATASGRPASRLAGPDRYSTAARIAQAAFPSGSTRAYLASGTSFADALSAGSVQDGPVLLVPRNGDLPSSVSDALSALGVRDVVVIGGPNAIAASVAAQASSGRTSRRISGDDRYATSVAMAQWAQPLTSGAQLTLVSGENFPDGLAAGTMHRGPVVLVPACGSLPSSVSTYLGTNSFAGVAIVGGPASVCTQTVSYIVNDSGAIPTNGFDATPVSSDDTAASQSGECTSPINPPYDKPIVFAFNGPFPDDEKDGVRAAIRTWTSAVPGLQVLETTDPTRANLLISFESGRHDDHGFATCAFDGTPWFHPDLLAHSTSIGDPGKVSYIHFDKGDHWTTSTKWVSVTGSLYKDINSVALHEFGHVIGLGHSPKQGDVMYPSVDGVHRSLSSNDISRAKALYPTTPPTKSSPPPTPPEKTISVHIEDDYLGGTWARNDPNNGTWYAEGTRPPNGAYWYPNGKGVAVDCARSAAAYYVKFADGHQETWTWWLHVTDGKWYPAAATQEIFTDGNPGVGTC